MLTGGRGEGEKAKVGVKWEEELGQEELDRQTGTEDSLQRWSVYVRRRKKEEEEEEEDIPCNIIL